MPRIDHIQMNDFVLNPDTKPQALHVRRAGALNEIVINGDNFDTSLEDGVNFIVYSPDVLCYGFQVKSDPAPTRTKIYCTFKAKGRRALHPEARVFVYVFNEYGSVNSTFPTKKR